MNILLSQRNELIMNNGGDKKCQKENVMLVAKKRMYLEEKCVQMGILYAEHVIFREEVHHVHYVKSH